VLLATDGVTEAEDKDGEPFGDAGLTAIATKEDLEELLQRVMEFQAPNEATDDCTMLQVKYRG
jgi:sigma-B regulation protein RsbU (phosphoserine phosphatase)